MADRTRTFWTSDRVHGPGGRYRIVVSRLPAGGGGQRDHYSATLFKIDGDADQVVEAGFWESSSPPHDADKLAFRERVRRAADQAPQGEPKQEEH